MRSTDEILGWRSRKARDRDAGKLGTIEEIYLDADSGQPQWAAVKTGLFGSKLTFVPLEGARPEGDDVILDWPEHVVKDAPRIDADGQLSPEEEDRLYDHYERYDSPEYHAGGVEGDASARRDDDDLPTVAEGTATSGGAGRDDDALGARPQGGPDPGPGGTSSTRSPRRETVPSDGRSSDRETVSSGLGSSSDETISSGADASSSGAPTESGTRRPRIKRIIEEELAPDGPPVRRSTRTEELFD